ncbi:MAG: 5'/3'-nucleotidase SurE [bacterium]|nr:5'/3'-nucleotidase SurE [bacterium]
MSAEKRKPHRSADAAEFSGLIGRLRILLANDDGYDAVGLRSLEPVLAEFGEVWVVAPDRERSATSNAMSIREELTLRQVGERRFSLTGYPADCVNLGLHSDLFPDFDLVVSGMNHGPNLGDDVHYSGTVAGARQAAVHQLRGVAVSYGDYEPTQQQLERAARWLGVWLKSNLAELGTGIVYNINYPGESAASDAPLPEVRYTYQGKRTYHDDYFVNPETAGYANDAAGDEWRVRIKGTDFGHIKQDHSDSEAVLAGFVSITPLSTFTTDRRELRKWFHKTRIKQARRA